MNRDFLYNLKVGDVLETSSFFGLMVSNSDKDGNFVLSEFKPNLSIPEDSKSEITEVVDGQHIVFKYEFQVNGKNTRYHSENNHIIFLNQVD